MTCRCSHTRDLTRDGERRICCRVGKVVEKQVRPATPSDAFLAVVAKHLTEHREVVVLTHDNPDPDGIAAGWAIRHLIETSLHCQVRFIAGGEILRAENRKVVELLQPPLQLEPCPTLPPEALIVLVDTAIEATNHVGIDATRQPVAVLDHHARVATGAPGAIYRDVREDVAATASLAASYLQEQQVEPPERLATALFYAIQTETRGGEFRHSPLDRAMVGWLAERANPSWLSEIADAPLARGYFSDLVLALQATSLYGDCAVCFLPQAQSAEIVGEVADLLLRCETVTAVLCAARCRGDILLSVRTAHDSPRSAVEITRRILEGLGRGGGHTHRAGGAIRKVTEGDAAAVTRELKNRFLAAWGAEPAREERLVPKDAIIRCL